MSYISAFGMDTIRSERRGGGRSMDEVHTELHITKGMATAEHTLWDVGFLSHLEHAAGPVPDPFPDPLPGPFPDPPGRRFSGTCDRSQIARTHTALRPWQVPMGFEMAGFPPATLPTKLLRNLSVVQSCFFRSSAAIAPFVSVA